MNFRHLRAFSVCVIGCVIAQLLVAALSPPPLPAHAEIQAAFDALDRSRNRAIGLVEWTEASDAQFARWDRNGDDSLTFAEVRTDALLLDTLPGSRTETGHYSRADFRRARAAMFATADIDRNEYLTFPEFELLVLLRRSGWDDTSGYGRILPGEMSVLLEKSFRLLDRDGNGFLSGDETRFFAPAHLAVMDPHRTGRLALEQVYRGYRFLVGYDTRNHNEGP